MPIPVQEFQPHGLRERVLAAVVRTFLRAVLKPVFSPRWSVAVQRRWMSWTARWTVVARATVFVPGEVGGVGGLWVRDARSPRRSAGAHHRAAPTVLYVHGGAYCLGSAHDYRALTAALARASGMPNSS